MSKHTQDVLVVDSEKRFLEYIHPGRARRLLREKKAKIYSRRPFAIMLFKTVSATSIRRRKVMPVPRNFTEFFKEERDIYVQNLANAQVSCEFPIAPNRNEGFLFANNRDPVNLTQFIPFDAIKASMDFRKMLSRRPPALQLLTEEEYKAYFAGKAKRSNMLNNDGEPDVDAAIDASEEKRRRTSDRNYREPVAASSPEPIHEVVEKGTGPGGAARFGERNRVAHNDVVGEDEVINPRVLHFCNQVKAEIEESERMPAAELLESLQDIPNLTLDDYEHIRAHSYYKSVKKWAQKQAADLASHELDDEDDSVAQV